MQYEKRRAQILATAFETFLSYGFRRTSLEQIAEQVGVSRPALYRYFASKEELFAALVEEFHDRALERARSAVTRSEGKPADDRLLGVFRAWYEQGVEVVLSSPHGVELMEANQTLCGELVEARTDSLVTLLSRVLKEAERPHPKRTARMLYAASKGFLTNAKDAAEFRGLLRDLMALLA